MSGVLGKPVGDISCAALIIFEGITAAGGTVGGLRSVDVHGVVFGVVVKVGQGLLVLAIVVEADRHPVLHVGDEDMGGIGLQPSLEALDGFLKTLLHGDGKSQIKFDARFLNVLGEAADQLAHLDFGILELFRVDECLGAQEGDDGDVGPFAFVDTHVNFVLNPGGGGAGFGAALFGLDVEHAFDRIALVLLALFSPTAEALGLGAPLELAEFGELLIDVGAVGQHGGSAVDAGQPIGHQQLGEVLLTDLHHAKEALLAAAHGIFPARPDGKFLAGEGALGKFFALGAQGDNLRHGDAKVVGLACVAVLMGFVSLGSIHVVQTNNEVLATMANVEAVTIHIPIAKHRVFQLFPAAGDGRGGEDAGAKEHGEE